MATLTISLDGTSAKFAVTDAEAARFLAAQVAITGPIFDGNNGKRDRTSQEAFSEWAANIVKAAFGAVHAHEQAEVAKVEAAKIAAIEPSKI